MIRELGRKRSVRTRHGSYNTAKISRIDGNAKHVARVATSIFDQGLTAFSIPKAHSL